MTKSQLIKQILNARTKAQIARANKAIEKYTKDNGIDPDVYEAAEQMYYIGKTA